MKITKRQLRQIIREYKKGVLPKNHIDGQPWSGSLEDLADAQGNTWGGGAVVDPKGWKENVKMAVHWTNGTANSANARKLMERDTSALGKIKSFINPEKPTARSMRAPELNAIVDAVIAAKGKVPHSKLRDLLFGLNAAIATGRVVENKQSLKEELDIEDQRAMDMGIIPYPDGTYAGDFDGSQMDLEDYQRLENLLQKDLKVFLRGGYTKEDIIEALKSIVEDAQ
tara:strand:+ start:45 stop:722 length:678 start_codon:yes stop_codon:yes gene_type:complete